MNHNFSGAAAGFIVTYVINDPDHDTEGFVGYLPSDHSIYVVYRGSETIKNWMSDMNADHTDYFDGDCVNCTVHEGFLNAELHVINSIYDEVYKLYQKYGTKKVKTTGHSLGAALANLTAMDLNNWGFDVSMINFG
jgi:hypothetical protein